MSALTAAQFGLFFNVTRSSIATGPNFIANLAQATRYPFFALLKGATPFSFAQGGQSIIDSIQIGDANTGGYVDPDQNFTLQFVNTSRTLTVPWAFGASHKAWTDAELTLHTSGGDKVRIKNFAKFLDQQQRTAHINWLNSTLFARPNSATMEAANVSSRAAYSLPALISEDTTRFRPPVAVWTVNTIEQIDVTTESGWRNQVSTYNPGAFNDPSEGVLKGLDDMLLKVTYETVPEAGAAFKPASSSNLVIFTNRDGYRRVQGACRANNDRLKSLQDPAVGDIAFDGARFMHAPQLDTELLDQTTGASAAYTGNPYPDGYPRYYVVNKENAHPVFHEGGIMQPKPVFAGTLERPTVNAAYLFTTFNTMTNNRKRLGIVCPA